MRKNAVQSFFDSFQQGYVIGKQLKKDREEDALKDDLRSAATTAMVENQTSGEYALGEFKAKYVPQDGGPQTADEYIAQNPEAFAGLQGRKAGFAVKGQTFDDVGDARDYARGMNMSAMGRVYAQHGDPEKGARLESEARQQELQGLQLKSAKRKDADEAFRANLDAFIRGSANLSDQEFLTQAAALATNGKQDNLGFAYEINPQTGGVEILQHDRNTRQITGRQPWDGDREKVVSALLKYSGAAGFDAARKEDKADTRYNKELGLKEREVAVKEEANRINDAYRKGVIGIQERELALRGLAIRSQSGLGTPIGMSDDGTKLLFNNPKSPNGFSEQPLPAGYSKLFNKVTGARDPREAPAIPKEVVTEYAKNYFALPPKMQDEFRLRNPDLHAAAFGQTGFRVGAKAMGGGTEGKPGETQNAGRDAPRVYPNREQYVAPDAPTTLGPKLGLWWDKAVTPGIKQTPEWQAEIRRREAALYGAPVVNHEW